MEQKTIEQQINEALKEISDLRNCKVGDKVWTVQNGWTEVVEIDLTDKYPIDNDNNTYSLDGLYVENEHTPSCFTQNPYEYILKKFGNQERIVEVEIGGCWFLRKLINVMPNGYAAVYGAKGANQFCDSIEKTNEIGVYGIWREFTIIPTFTKEEICKVLGVDNFKIKE